MARNYANEAKITKNNVLTLLEEVQETRNSDRLLLVRYWERFDNVSMTNFEQTFLAGATPAETITRARRSIQSGGLFPPTNPDVARKRGIRQEEARQYHAG